MVIQLSAQAACRRFTGVMTIHPPSRKYLQLPLGFAPVGCSGVSRLDVTGPPPPRESGVSQEGMSGLCSAGNKQIFHESCCSHHHLLLLSGEIAPRSPPAANCPQCPLYCNAVNVQAAQPISLKIPLIISRPGWMESYLAAEIHIMRDDEAARRHSGRLQRQRRP